MGELLSHPLPSLSKVCGQTCSSFQLSLGLLWLHFVCSAPSLYLHKLNWPFSTKVVLRSSFLYDLAAQIEQMDLDAEQQTNLTAKMVFHSAIPEIPIFFQRPGQYNVKVSLNWREKDRPKSISPEGWNSTIRVSQGKQDACRHIAAIYCQMFRIFVALCNEFLRLEFSSFGRTSEVRLFWQITFGKPQMEQEQTAKKSKTADEDS